MIGSYQLQPSLTITEPGRVIRSVIPSDYNHDGHLDVLISGYTHVNDQSSMFVHVYFGNLNSICEFDMMICCAVLLFCCVVFCLADINSLNHSTIHHPTIHLISALSPVVADESRDELLLMDYDGDLRVDLYGTLASPPSANASRTFWVNRAAGASSVRFDL